jgi:hypothetical protein
VPKDIEDWEQAAEPWKRWLSMVDQNTALWCFAVIAFLYIFWMDVKPRIQWRFSRADREELRSLSEEMKQVSEDIAEGIGDRNKHARLFAQLVSIEGRMSDLGFDFPNGRKLTGVDYLKDREVLFGSMYPLLNGVPRKQLKMLIDASNYVRGEGPIAASNPMPRLPQGSDRHKQG